MNTVNNKQPTHLFCGKYYCIKTLLPHGVLWEFDDSIPLQDILELSSTYTGRHYVELPTPKPTNLKGYPVYQGELL